MNTIKGKARRHWTRLAAWTCAGVVVGVISLVLGSVAALRFGATNAQKARWASAALQQVIPGRITMSSLHWQLPATVELLDVRVTAPGAAPDAAPLITAHTMGADLEVAALLEHRIAIKHVRVGDANITMTQSDPNTPFDLVNAFVPPDAPGTPQATETEPWLVSIDDISLKRADFTLQAPEINVKVRDASIDEGAFWLQGDAMGTTAKLHGAVAVHAGETQLHTKALDLSIEQGVWTMHGDDDVDVGLKRGRLETQGNTAELTGHLHIAAQGMHDVDAKASIELDISAPIWQAYVPAVFKKALHGKGSLQVSLQGDQQSLAYSVDVGEVADAKPITLGHAPVNRLHFTGTYAAPVLTVTQLELHSGEASIEAGGRVALMPDKNIVLGEHEIDIKARRVPLARDLAPFIEDSALLPGNVDMQIHSAGAALWPPRNAASLQMTARGIPKRFVGVPDPLQIASKFQGQGDKIHIEAFGLHGEGTDLGLQGDIPLKPDGVMDIVSQLKYLKSGKALKRLKVPMGAREVRLRTRLTGTFSNPHAEGMLWADDLRAQDHILQVHAPFTFADQRLRVQNARLTLDDGHAEVTGQLSLLGEHPQIDLQASLQKIEAAASGLPLTGQIDGEIIAQGPLTAPIGRGRVTWHAAGWQQSHARAEVMLVARSDARGMHVTSLEIAPSKGGSSKLAGDVRWDTRQLDFTWEAADITADWLASIAGAPSDVDARGTMRASGHVRGPWEDPRGEAHITLEKAGIADAELGDVVIDVHGDAQRIAATAGLSQHHSQVALETKLWFASHEHPLRASGTARLSPVWIGDFIPGLAARTADATLTGEGHWWWNTQAGLHASAEIAQLDAHVANKTMSLERPAHLRWSDGEASIDDMHLRGDLAALWVRGRWGTQINGQVDGHLDLRVLSDFVPTFGSADGTMDVALRVDGTPEHPDARGKLHITSPVVMRLRQVPGEIYVDRGLVTLSPKGLVISDWRGRYGFGALQLDGHVALKDFKPDAYDVRLRATDIPCRTPELLLETNADVQVTGAGAQPMVKGKIDITRGRYIKRFDLHDFYVQAKPGAASVALKDKAPGLESIGLDVHVGTSNDLVVNVDAGIFAVKTDLQANLHVTGNVVYPKINGSLHAEGGTLKFPEASLALTEANLDFTPGAGHAIDAKVHMLGEGTVTSSGPSSQAYAVTLQLDGDLEKMLLDLRATPDRTRLEVLSLLTTGHADLSELVQQSPDDNKLNAALVFAGSQVSEPVTRYASAQIERYAKLKVDLGAQVTQDAVTVTASKQIMSRLRLQGAYQHGIGTDSAAVVAGAQVALTDKLFFEGTQTLPTNNANTVDNYAQGSLQLKWRLLGH